MITSGTNDEYTIEKTIFWRRVYAQNGTFYNSMYQWTISLFNYFVRLMTNRTQSISFPSFGVLLSVTLRFIDACLTFIIALLPNHVITIIYLWECGITSKKMCSWLSWIDMLIPLTRLSKIPQWFNSFAPILLTRCNLWNTPTQITLLGYLYLLTHSFCARCYNILFNRNLLAQK